VAPLSLSNSAADQAALNAYNADVTSALAMMANAPSGSGIGLRAIGGGAGVSGTGSIGVYGDGPTGVRAIGLSNGLWATSNGSSGNAVNAQATGASGIGVFATSPGNSAVYASNSGAGRGVYADSATGEGVFAQGRTGVAGVAGSPGIGVLASDGGSVTNQALKVLGRSTFSGGSVTFTSHVDFSGATITGWSLPATVSAPLSLTNTGAQATLHAANTAVSGVGAYVRATGTSGKALIAEGASIGLSVSAASGSGRAIVVRGSTSNFLIDVDNTAGSGPAINAVASNGGNALAAVNNGPGDGLYGQADSGSSWGVHGVSDGGIAVYAQSLNNRAMLAEGALMGISATASGAGGVGVFAGGPVALSTSGNVLFNGAGKSVTFNTHVDFSGATITGWNLPAIVAAPLSLTNTGLQATLHSANMNVSGIGASVRATGTAARALVVEGGAIGLSVTVNSGTGRAFTASGNSSNEMVNVIQNGAGNGIFVTLNGAGRAVQVTQGNADKVIYAYNTGLGDGIYGEASSGYGVRGYSDAGAGVEGISPLGTGMRADGPLGLSATSAAGTAILARAPVAISSSGNVLFNPNGVYRSVTFNTHVDFSGATITGFTVNIPNPLSLSNNLAGNVITGINTGSGRGVSGSSATGTGVYGSGATGLAGYGSTYGVYGDGGSSYGVYGQSSAGGATVGGVNGNNSSGGPGVYGFSTGGYGVYGSSGGSGEGVHADSGGANAAIHGINTANGRGVFGQSNAGVGVYGQAAGGGTYGVEGLTFAPGYAGVHGIDSSSNSSTAGVLGDSSSGTGVLGIGTGTAVAIRAQGNSVGLSATAANGVAVYGINNGGGGFVPTAKFLAQGTNHAVEGKNTGSGALGTLGGELTNGQTGVYGFASVGDARAILGTNAAGYGVRGEGLTGVAGVAMASGQTGLVGSSNGQSNALALHAVGDSRFDSGSVSFSAHVDFGSATVTGLPSNIPVPLSLTGSVAWPNAVIRGTNGGNGHGIAGYASVPGSLTGSPNINSTITAGVYGYSSASISAGVMGANNSSNSSNAGVIGLSGQGTGVIGNGFTGLSGEANSPSGWGVTAMGAGGGTGQGLKVDGRVVLQANALATQGFAVSITQNSTSYGAGGLESYNAASGAAAVMGISTDLSTPGPSNGIPGIGVIGRGPVGVLGQTTVSGGIGVIGSASGSSSSAGVMGESSGNSTGVNGDSAFGTGVSARGFYGLYATSSQGGGSAIQAQGSNGARSLVSYGDAVFYSSGASSSVSFSTHVDFSGANVTGLSPASVSATSHTGLPAGFLAADNGGAALYAVRPNGGGGNIIVAEGLIPNSIGVRANVYGANSKGIEALSQDYIAITAESQNSNALVARTYGSSFKGIYGAAAVNGATGVYGVAEASGSTAVHGFAGDLASTGVVAQNSGGGDALRVDGRSTFNGDINMGPGSYRITNLATPSSASEAANKSYVDSFSDPYKVSKFGDTMSGTLGLNLTSGLYGVDSVISAGGGIGVHGNASGSGGWGGWFQGSAQGLVVDANGSGSTTGLNLSSIPSSAGVTGIGAKLFVGGNGSAGVSKGMDIAVSGPNGDMSVYGIAMAVSISGAPASGTIYGIYSDIYSPAGTPGGGIYSKFRGGIGTGIEGLGHTGMKATGFITGIAATSTGTSSVAGSFFVSTSGSTAVSATASDSTSSVGGYFAGVTGLAGVGSAWGGYFTGLTGVSAVGSMVGVSGIATTASGLAVGVVGTGNTGLRGIGTSIGLSASASSAASGLGVYAQGLTGTVSKGTLLGLSVTASGASADGIFVHVSSSASGISVIQGGNSGLGARVQAEYGAYITARYVGLSVTATDSFADGANISLSSTGTGLTVVQNGAGYALKLTGGNGAVISSNALGLSVTAASATGQGVYVQVSSTGSALFARNDSVAGGHAVDARVSSSLAAATGAAVNAAASGAGQWAVIASNSNGAFSSGGGALKVNGNLQMGNVTSFADSNASTFTLTMGVTEGSARIATVKSAPSTTYTFTGVPVQPTSRVIANIFNSGSPPPGPWWYDVDVAAKTITFRFPSWTIPANTYFNFQIIY
jgi:collagen type VII alpha